MLDLKGLIPPLGCVLHPDKLRYSSPLSRGPDLLRKNPDLLPVLL